MNDERRSARIAIEVRSVESRMVRRSVSRDDAPRREPEKQRQ